MGAREAAAPGPRSAASQPLRRLGASSQPLPPPTDGLATVLARAVAQRARAGSADDLVAYSGGQSGTLKVFDAGKLAYDCPAVSGHSGYGEWIPGAGPIPTGEYAMHPRITQPTVTTIQAGTAGAAAISRGYQELTSTDRFECDPASAHYCNVPCGTATNPGRMCATPVDTWGTMRIKIEGGADVPIPGTKRKQHRAGFYLHGGNPKDPVSSGCVKTLDTAVFAHIRKLSGTRGRVRFCVGGGCKTGV